MVKDCFVASLLAMTLTLTPDEVISRLTALYGEPEWRPHGDATAELVLTLLSQNTSDANSGRAFARLLQRFPDWQALLDAPVGEVEDAIRPGGVGPKTAACVLLFGLGMPALPVDTHVYRVATRLGLVSSKLTPEKAQTELEARVPAADHYRFHILLIRHGRHTCTARAPACGACPLADHCPYPRLREQGA